MQDNLVCLEEVCHRALLLCPMTLRGGAQVRRQPQNVTEDTSSCHLRACARPPHDQRLLLVPRRGEGDNVVGAGELRERVVPLVPPQLHLALLVHHVHDSNVPQDL